MRLFLSSQDFGNYSREAVQLAGKNKRAAFIKNAQDDKPAKERNFTTPNKKRMFESVGFEFEEIDLRDYFGRREKLEEIMVRFGSVWCAGGNTFILRRAMKASGLDEILKDWLPADKIMYGGWSAGSCIVAPSLRGIEIGDRADSDAVPPRYPFNQTIWDGLGLVQFMIVPHYNQDWFKQYAEENIAYLKANNIPYKALNDGQVVIIDSDKERVLK